VTAWRTQLDLQDRNRRIQYGAQAMAMAASYGLIRCLRDAIERNHSRGWADHDLRIFRLADDEEVREAWQIVEGRQRGWSQ
jgi:hypothetical protein